MKVAIVEDETLIRAGIRRKLEKLGQQVVFDTDDGQLLIEYLKDENREQPEILFVDICMPAMNGLTMMERIKKDYSQLAVVILSGYNKFEYARDAMRLGVYDYLLKPINNEELQRVLSALEQRQIEEKLRKQQECMENLADYICSMECVPLLEETDRLLKEVFPNGFVLRLVLLSNWGSHLNWFHREIDAPYSFIYPDRPNLLVSFLDKKEDGALFRNALEGVSFTAWYSKVITKTSKLCCEMRKGIRCVKDCLMLEKSRVIVQGECTDDEQHIKQWENYYEVHSELLFKGIEEKSREEIMAQLEGILKYPGISQNRHNQAWLWMAFKICEHYHIHNGIVDTAWMQEYDTLDEFVEGAQEAFLQLIEEQSEIWNHENDKPVLEAIIDYVNKNYAEDITLKGTSEKFFVNRSHLARIFKLKTKMTFNGYLTQLRIEKACELLSQGISVNRAAEMVGYDSSRYFSRVFYKVKGCIPSMYRNGEHESE